jgi:hypothetical protein
MFNRKLVNAAFRTISLVGTQLRRLPIGGSATYIPDRILEASGLVWLSRLKLIQRRRQAI